MSTPRAEIGDKDNMYENEAEWAAGRVATVAIPAAVVLVGFLAYGRDAGWPGWVQWLIAALTYAAMITILAAYGYGWWRQNHPNNN